ncbi:hypothetical protein [Leptospira noguchii]|uniref:hypothetical protein n=1 Tax=Leptospira noguchii TaxID=28182 RepID=UPI001FB5D362|nr:hypothetical protein [Leptospira noguchii]UOG49153.1 hypothetical protein MAL00_02200 [Leptospira noguchii]
MLRSIVSSIEFEKFRRNWSEKNSVKRFLRKRLKLNTTPTYGSAFTESLHLSLLFAPIFLRRTHVIYEFLN